MPTLSKSDFILAADCAKKLVYKKALYPTANDTNEYMKMLAEGGYVVGKMATLLFPGGIEITGNTAECVAATKEYLSRENVVLFEAAIASGNQIVRVDILEKTGPVINLIEVKAKSYDSGEPEKINKSEFEKYVDDLAYQYHVVREAMPEADIRAYLMMPDKNKRTRIDALPGWFAVQADRQQDNKELEEAPAREKPSFSKPEVSFRFEDDNNRDHYIARLQSDGILTLVDLTEAVAAMQKEIAFRSANLLRILDEGIRQDDYRISVKCRGCEFNTPDESKSGYRECLGPMADVQPHVFDLYNGTRIKTPNKTLLLDELLQTGKASLSEITEEMIVGEKKTPGVLAERQLMQIENTLNNREWISPDLQAHLSSFDYPLHFIDFETYTGALPFHQNMRPYELIAFQWSCHTIDHLGATPRHAAWIHTGPEFPDAGRFPNFEFARSLMKHIGRSGTPLMYSFHERTVMRTIRKQMEVFGEDDPELAAWLLELAGENKGEGRWQDMNDMTKRFYFHPYMKGKTSIKKVLPAIWSHHPELHDVSHFRDYAPEKFQGGIVDPYDELSRFIQPSDEDDDPSGDAVSGGTDAMRAYYRIRFDTTMNEAQRHELRQQLLEYCKLDTMAMVIIAHHWGLR
jgi:hypothetical protein